MTRKPFAKLAVPRAVQRSDLPIDLATFFANYEGIGLESDGDPECVVWLCRLDEVVRVGWTELGVIADVPEGWDRFTALRVGIGRFFEKIVYVLDAPSCPPGSILAIGGNVPGLGGDGPYALDSSLVLAANFLDWLAHLERWGWAEPAIAVAWELTERERQELYQYYRALNPRMLWNGE
jgi:hypothetical protein